MLSGAGPLHGTRDVLQNPLQLGAGEIGVDDETGLAPDHRGVAGFSQPVARPGGAAILPDDRVADRLAGFAIPDDGGLALVGDADGGDVGGGEPGLLECVGGDSGLRGPDFIRVVFDPAGLREELAKLLLGDGDDGALVVEDDGARTGRALIESEDVFHGEEQVTEFFDHGLHG